MGAECCPRQLLGEVSQNCQAPTGHCSGSFSTTAKVGTHRLDYELIPLPSPPYLKAVGYIFHLVCIRATSQPEPRWSYKGLGKP